MTAGSDSPSSGVSFTIRPGQIDDVHELWRLVSLLADHLDDQHRYRSTPESFARYGFGDRPMFETLLAYSGHGAPGLGAIGACVYLADFSTWLARPGVYILDLVVEPDHRGRRIGSADDDTRVMIRRGLDDLLA